MTEDDQLPFDGPSDDQQSQATLDAAKTPDGAEAMSSASDGDDSVDDSSDPTARALEDPVAEPRDEPLTVEEREVAAEPSAPGAGLVETNESSPAGAAPVSEPVAPAPTLYLLTNRMNLNAILSSRLVAPRESFQKYYTDLLQQTPGWVPLLREAPTSVQIEAVTTERGAGAPVIVEFPRDVAGKLRLDAPVVFVPAVALSRAVAIHLPSERDLREHRARGYSNVHAHDELLRVTPELFASETVDTQALIPPKAAPAVDWRRIDRIRGAVNAAVRAASSGEQLALVAALVGAPKLPAAMTVPPWLAWSEVDDHNARVIRPQPDRAVPDHTVFRAAYEVLGERDVTEAWSPNAVLDAVEARVRKADLADDATDAMIRNLGRVRSIVNVEVDFEPFRPSARALVSAKALLLVLLRQELDQLLAWSDEETGADDATRVVAAVLAGRLRGLSRESTELRSLELDDLTASWAVHVARGRPALLGKAHFVANSRGTSLQIDGTEVATQSALLPDLLSKYQKDRRC
ncbi:hypothetical protein KV102_00140 [Mumia sp. zg.B53]|uniref:hypothetical protein n=1 Tax=Mumia sp. zg.B53 TaxID=2855449 RepID=UPI001C6EC86C|nr:hypothetical protein [Mumia sp. zg.B53]MBW9213234.1 hypothetical protein [Mumia sp. zg.B53]